MVAVELRIRVGLLEKNIAGILLICQNPFDCGCAPVIAFPGRNLFFIQHVGNFCGANAGKSRSENPFYNCRLLRIDDYVLLIPIVAVGRASDLERRVFKSALHRPLAIL